jgi:putative transposase
VGHVVERFVISERRACGLVGLPRSSIRYRAAGSGDDKLRERICILAYRWQRYGYRRLWVLLRREGWLVNHKRVYRIYRSEGLAVRKRKRKRKRVAGWRCETPAVPVRANSRWSMDFMSDATEHRGRLKVLTMVDEYTRECLAIEVDTSLPGFRVVGVLERLREIRGLPEEILMDNGPEFTSRVLDVWAHRRGVKLRYIEPGKPMQNPYIESFNGKFRDECLNQHWFLNVTEAKQIIESWRQEYNEIRPHSSIGNVAPAEFARRVSRIHLITDQPQRENALAGELTHAGV